MKKSTRAKARKPADPSANALQVALNGLHDVHSSLCMMSTAFTGRTAEDISELDLITSGAAECSLKGAIDCLSEAESLIDSAMKANHFSSKIYRVIDLAAVTAHLLGLKRPLDGPTTSDGVKITNCPVESVVYTAALSVQSIIVDLDWVLERRATSRKRAA